VFAERYLYLPSFGFVLLIALALSRAKAVKPGLASGLVIISLVVAVVYSAGTVSRNAVWRDDVTLFTDTVRKSPDAARVYIDLGNSLDNLNHFEDAVLAYRKAIELNPQLQSAHYNLGIAYFRKHRFEEAKKEFQIAVLLDPLDTEARDYLKTVSLLR
ncbi:MAG: tetratricopeptide repeat protein, partial [Thermodesulfovibrionales bacterium]